MDVMERRLCGRYYLCNVLRTSVCQIVENVKKYEKAIKYHSVKSAAEF